MECQPIWHSFGLRVVIIENKEEYACEDMIWFSTLLSNMPTAREKSVASDATAAQALEKSYINLHWIT